MSFWPFRKATASGDENQRSQVEESTRRIVEESARKVEQARATFDAAAAGAVKAIDARYEQTSYLREALKTLIDRQSNGRFDMSSGKRS